MPSKEHDDVVALMWSLRASQSEEPTPIHDVRRGADANGDLFPIPASVEIEPIQAKGFRAERYLVDVPTTNAVILYLHGGAYISGSLRSHRALCARLAAATGAAVVAVDYRLAPEHPYPAAVVDAQAAYEWLLATGADPARVVLAGDSAGGGLVVATLLSLHAADFQLPAGAVLLSPWLDLSLTANSITSAASLDPVLTADLLERSAQAYAGSDRSNPLVSPVHAGASQLAALPPVLILAGTADLLVDDSRTFTDNVRAAGGHVDLDVEDGLMHVWPFVDGVPEAADALERIARWISSLLAAVYR